jgi:hypothetical protein
VAESIDLTGLKRKDDKNSDAGGLSTPPAAAAAPGMVRDGPPLPAGLPVRAINPESLTDFEKVQLTEVAGWKEGDPIPDNMAELFAEATAAREADAAVPLPLPVSPDTPPVSAATMNTVPVENLTPEKQDEVNATLRAAMQGQLDQAEANKADEEAARRIQQDPDVAREVVAGAHAAAAEQRAKAEAAEPEAQPAPETLVDPKDYCPHCSWDMTRDDVDAPPLDVRQRFLQSIIGQKPYLEQCSLLGGAMLVTFRTLTTAESDAAMQQAFTDRDAGEFLSDIDFWERVNRYRMYLQILKVERKNMKTIDLPEGLSEETNPNVGTYWKPAELKLIERYMQQHVLTHESISRVLQAEIGRFNRTTSQMEANADRPDFWNLIEDVPSS